MCPEGSRKLRFPDYVTMAQDGGRVVSLMHQPFLPVRYVTKTWSVALLNKKKYIYSYLKRIVYDKFLKPQQPF